MGGVSGNGKDIQMGVLPFGRQKVRPEILVVLRPKEKA